MASLKTQERGDDAEINASGRVSSAITGEIRGTLPLDGTASARFTGSPRAFESDRLIASFP